MGVGLALAAKMKDERSFMLDYDIFNKIEDINREVIG